MNQKVSAVIVLVILLGVGGYFAFKKSESVSIKDCGVDTKCFVVNFKSCVPSKIFGGAMEVIGGTQQSCKIEVVSSDNPQYTGGQRLSMECVVKDVNLFKEDEINGYSIYQKSSMCTGLLYDMYVSIDKAAQKQ